MSPNESSFWAKEQATRAAGRNPSPELAGPVPESLTDSKESVSKMLGTAKSYRFDTGTAGIDLSKVWPAIFAGSPSLARITSGPGLRLLNVYRREGS